MQTIYRRHFRNSLPGEPYSQICKAGIIAKNSSFSNARPDSSVNLQSSVVTRSRLPLSPAFLAANQALLKVSQFGR